MYFPRYWAKASVAGKNRIGKKMEVETWGWSDVGEAEARALAESRAQSILARLPLDKRDRLNNRDQYYENRPFREPILHDASTGQVSALITRNSFGCEVLNTAHALFADIDFVEPDVGLLDSLFGGARKKIAAAHVEWETQTLAKLRDLHRSSSAWGFRVYRTAGGLRLLVTSTLVDANSTEALDFLKSVGSDPLYLRLCQYQKSFRARLTPKPWRCGLKQLSVHFPWAEKSEQVALDNWLKSYQPKCTSFAVCEFLQTVGGSVPAPELKSIISLHDERTSVGSGRPLA
jgi:hypothetical protein